MEMAKARQSRLLYLDFWPPGITSSSPTSVVTLPSVTLPSVTLAVITLPAPRYAARVVLWHTGLYGALHPNKQHYSTEYNSKLSKPAVRLNGLWRICRIASGLLPVSALDPIRTKTTFDQRIAPIVTKAPSSSPRERTRIYSPNNLSHVRRLVQFSLPLQICHREGDRNN